MTFVSTSFWSLGSLLQEQGAGVKVKIHLRTRYINTSNARCQAFSPDYRLFRKIFTRNPRGKKRCGKPIKAGADGKKEEKTGNGRRLCPKPLRTACGRTFGVAFSPEGADEKIDGSLRQGTEVTKIKYKLFFAGVYDIIY